MPRVGSGQLKAQPPTMTQREWQLLISVLQERKMTALDDGAVDYRERGNSINTGVRFSFSKHWKSQDPMPEQGKWTN